MAVDELAAAHYRQQARHARLTAKQIRRLWRQVDRSAIAATWRRLVVPAFAVLTGAQAVAATNGAGYVAGLAGEYGLDAAGEYQLVPEAFAGVASDGRDLESLLFQPAVASLTALDKGATLDRALALGALSLDIITRTQIADAGRVAAGAATTADQRWTGYVRMTQGKTCSRCIILAGRRYEWNKGFLRHPRCDCVHVPYAEDVPDDIRTDPKAYFESLSRAEQDKVFTATGAQAIRDGADMGQVVNARRGAHGLGYAAGRLTAAEREMLRGGRERGHLERVRLFGRDLYVTTEGTTTRGLAGVRLGAKETGTKATGGRYRSTKAPRLMPESIYEIAGNDRDEAIRLLRRFGYII